MTTDHSASRTSREALPPRIRRRSDPAQWDLEEPLTLAEAVALLFPEGPLTVASLRTEIRKGRLRFSRVAGRLFVSRAAINSLFAPTAAAAPHLRPEPIRAAPSRPHGDRLQFAQEALASACRTLETRQHA